MQFLVGFGVLVCAVTFSQSAVILNATLPNILPKNATHESIIQGWMAADNQFPHQGFLVITMKTGVKNFCGTSLISPRWAITAAHCLYGAASTVLYFGHRILDYSPVRVASRRLFVHPGYERETLNNDIALIGLDIPVPIGDSIKPIRIARSFDDNIEGQVAIASGYGSTSDGSPANPYLNFVNLRIISNRKCATYYGPMIDQTRICAVGISTSSQGTCTGDSGGPLIVGAGNAASLIGIVSFYGGYGCSAGYPSGFVRPYKYMNWISGVTGLPAERFLM